MRAIDRGLRGLCASAAMLPVVLVVIALVAAAWTGLGEWSEGSLAVSAVWPATLDSLALALLTAVIAVPLGLGAAIYLEEYGGARGPGGRLLEANVALLSGVPAVVYGLLGLELFVRTLNMQLGLGVGALTLALVVLPMIVASSRVALRGVSPSQREAGLALGGTQWQVVRHVVLPIALPGVVSGILWAIARAVGEAAPLVVLGAMIPVIGGASSEGLWVLPVEIFAWVSGDQRGPAAAAIVALLLVLLVLTSLATIMGARAAGMGGAEHTDERRRPRS